MRKLIDRGPICVWTRRIIAVVLAISMVLIPVRFPGMATAAEQNDLAVPNYFADDYSAKDYLNGITYKWDSNAFDGKIVDGKYHIYTGPEKNTGAPVVGVEENRVFLKAEMFDPHQKMVVDIAQSWQDYTVEADVVRIDPVGNSQWVGIIGRVVQTDKGLCYYALSAMGDKIRLNKAYITDENKWTRMKIQESNTVKGVAGETIHLKLVFDGNNIKGYANDKLVVDYTDEGFYGAPLLSGSAGMYMYGRAWNGSFDNFRLTHDSDLTAFYDSFVDDRYFTGVSYRWKTMETPAAQNVTYTWTETLSSGITSQLINNEYVMNVGRTYAYDNYAVLNGTSTDGTDVDKTWSNYTVEVDVKRENASGTGDRVFLLGRLQENGSGYGLLFSGSGFSLWDFTEEGPGSRFRDTGSGLSGDMYDQYVHMKLAFKDNTVTTTLEWTDSEGNPQSQEYTYTDDTFGSGGVGLCVEQADGNAPLNVHFDNFKVTLEDGSVVYSDPFDSPILAPAKDAVYTLTEVFGQNGANTATSTLANGRYTIHIPKDRTWNYVLLNGQTADGVDVDQTWSDYSVQVDLRRNESSGQLRAGLVGRVTPVYHDQEFVGYTFYRIKSIGSETKVDKVYWDAQTNALVTTADWRLYNCDVPNNEWRTLKATFTGSTVTVEVYDEDGVLKGTDSFTDSDKPLLSGGAGMMTGYTTSNLSGSVDFDNLKVTMADGRVVFEDAFNSAPVMEPVDVTYTMTETFTTAKNCTPESVLIGGQYTITTQNDRTTAYAWVNGVATVGTESVDVDQTWKDYTVRVDVTRHTTNKQHTAGILGRITPVIESGELKGYQYYEVKIFGDDVRIFKQYLDTNGTLKNSGSLARLYVGSAGQNPTTLEAIFAGNSIKINLYDANGNLLNSGKTDADRTFTDDGTYGQPLLSGGIALAMFDYSSNAAWSASFDNLCVTLSDRTVAFRETFDSVTPQDVTYQWTEEYYTHSTQGATSGSIVEKVSGDATDKVYKIEAQTNRMKNFVWLNGDTAENLDVDATWTDYTVEFDICRDATNTNLGAGIIGRIQKVYDGDTLLGYTYYRIIFVNGEVKLYKVYWEDGREKLTTQHRMYPGQLGTGTWRRAKVEFIGNTIKVYIYNMEGAVLSASGGTYTDDGTYGAPLLSGGIALQPCVGDIDVAYTVSFDNIKITQRDGFVVFEDDFNDGKYFAQGGAVREDSYIPAGGSYDNSFDADGLTMENAYTPAAPEGDYNNAFDADGLKIEGGYTPEPSTEGCANGFFEEGLVLENAYVPALPERWVIADGVFAKNDADGNPMIVTMAGGGKNYAQNWKNYGVEADFMLTADEAEAGLVFGCAADGYYEFRVDGAKAYLYHVSTTQNVLGSVDLALDLNALHFMRVEIENGKIYCYVNGISVLEAEANIAGTVGVRAVSGVKFDNFVVYPMAVSSQRRLGTFDFDVSNVNALLSDWNILNAEDWVVSGEQLSYVGADEIGAVNLKSKTFARNYFAELIATPAKDTDVLAVTGRSSLDGKNYYQLKLSMQDGLTLIKTVNGVTESVATLTKGDLYRNHGIMLIPGTEFKLRIEMFDTTIRCFVGEQKLFHLNDTAVAAGVAGLAGSKSVAFKSLTTGAVYADPKLSFVYADGTEVTDLTVFKGKVPDIKGMYLKVDIGDGNPQLILLDTVMDDSKFDYAATGTVSISVNYDGVQKAFVYTVIERTAEIEEINAAIAALDLSNLQEAAVDSLSKRYNDLSAIEKSGISQENKDKLAAAQRVIDVRKYPELADYEIIFKDEFDTAASAEQYTNAQIVTHTRNTGYWYVENGVMLQYFEDDYMRTNSLESGFALKNKNFKAKSVSVDVQYIDPNQWIGMSVNFGPNTEGGYRFMISDKTTGYGGNRIRLYNEGALLQGVVEADESKWFKPGEWINLRMVFGDDGYIRCYINDVKYLEVKDKLTVRHDEYHESGTVMLYSAEGWGRFDNLVVYGEELPYEETPVYNTDLVPGEYIDDFSDETAGKSPSHWIELNTEDKWLVEQDGANMVYASKEHTADASETWLHVFESDVDYSAKLRVTDSGYYPMVALTARINAKASYIRAGYDFTLQKWFVKYRLAENFDEIAIYAEHEDADVDFTDWVDVRLVAKGSVLELYKNAQKVLTADVGTKIGPGRVGVYTERCNIQIDDVNLILTSGQGKVQDGVLEYYTSPMGITSTMGAYIEMPDGNILYYSDGYHAVSTDGGQTFTPTKDYAYFKTSTNIRLHNGDYVTIYTSNPNPDGVTPTVITAYRSTDGGHTWTSATLPTEAHSYAQPGGHIMEIKLADGNYRLFFTAPINKGEDAGTYARTFYSDDGGATWKESKTRAEDWTNLGVFCETFISAVSKDVTMASGKVIPAGTLVHSTCYNSSGTIRYSLSYDGGVTWEGDYALPEIMCPQGSCVVREDPSNPGTWYMLTLYSPQYQMYTARNRERVSLFRSEDGLNWNFVCDVDRWGDNGDGGCGQLLHATNAYMIITDDYVFVNFGRNEEWAPGNNIIYGRIYRFEKDKLVDHEIPSEYIVQDKSIVYIEGVTQNVPLNSMNAAEKVTFTVYYYDGTSEVVALKDAFATTIDTAELGTQKVVADYKHFRTVFNVNVVMGDAPVISGAEEDKTYCIGQEVTVSDANGDLESVTLDGIAVTLVNGKFTVTGKEGQQTIVATDKAGNVTTVKITVNAAHTGGEATCCDKAKCDVCGEAYGEKNADKHTKEAKWTITGDKHSKAYECCGKVVVEEAAHSGGEATCEHKAVCSVCNAEYGKLADHKGGEATCCDKAKCDVCGEAYGEKNADKHTKEAKWATTADKHSKAYECCGKVVVAEETHEWKNGKCEECGYEAAPGTEQKPIEIPADKETVKAEAKVEAGEEQHYELDEKMAGMTITIKGEGAYAIIDGKKYEAVNGVLEVKLPAKTGKIPVIIGNAGTKAGTFSITIATPSEDNSDTGDNTAIVLIGSLMALSVLAAGVLLVPDIRKKLMIK